MVDVVRQSVFQQMPDELIPGGTPAQPVPPEPIGTITSGEVETVIETIEGKPDGEKQSEDAFSAELDRVSKKVNP